MAQSSIEEKNKMKRKVGRKEYREAFKAIEAQVKEASVNLSVGSVSIYDETGSYGDDTVRLSVNWSCCGEQTPERAMAFANVLMMASCLASNFKYNGFVAVDD